MNVDRTERTEKWWERRTECRGDMGEWELKVRQRMWLLDELRLSSANYPHIPKINCLKREIGNNIQARVCAMTQN